MNHLLRCIFYQLIVRPFIYIILGLNIKHRHRLPTQGPAILVANHNSHLDTMVLMSLFPWAIQKNMFAVAAADYFLKNKLLAWFSKAIIGIIPITRGQQKHKKNPLADIQDALDQHKLIIFYPEGSRGMPEHMSEIKKGIAHLAKANPETPIYPIYFYGLGKALPKNEGLFVPFVTDVVIGEPVFGRADAPNMVDTVKASFQQLKKEVPTREWQ
jgi:1-acyl-sn-glycerol-3-phosphate acyltransferase